MAVDSPARVAVLGAGPIGLEVALYARYLGYEVDIIERGRVASSVLCWGHVRLFTPFHMNCSTLGLAALSAQKPDYVPPDSDAMLTGREWAEQYLIPLSQTDLLADHVQEQTTVMAVSRHHHLKGDARAEESLAEAPFRILTCDQTGGEHEAAADVVVDATGVYRNPNWIGQGGAPALGETSLRERIEYGIPDALGRERDTYADAHVLVIGDGHSAATTVVTLVDLAKQAPGTRVTWVTRGSSETPTPGPIQPIPNDPLPERERLRQSANASVQDRRDVVSHYANTLVRSVAYDSQENKWEVEFRGSREGCAQFDRFVANVGYRPDSSIYRELQVQSCYASEGPRKLAEALRSRDAADRLHRRSLGPELLLNPEPNFYILGAKSYGRDSSFLYSAGLQQIRELFTIVGDREDLDLYESVMGLVKKNKT